ncbi:MAG: hypothetical protein AB7O95_24910 [Geminicoccaceae bacterium]
MAKLKAGHCPSGAAGSFRGGGFVSRRRVRFAAAGSFRGGGFVSRRRVRFAAAGSFRGGGFWLSPAGLSS